MPSLNWGFRFLFRFSFPLNLMPSTFNSTNSSPSYHPINSRIDTSSTYTEFALSKSPFFTLPLYKFSDSMRIFLNPFLQPYSIEFSIVF
jgi:hypothetical protein